MFNRVMDYGKKIDLLIKEKTGCELPRLLLFVFIISTFAITLIRAAITQITYDEAMTYLYWCRPAIFRPEGMKEIYFNSNANNHLLNTYMITLFDHFFKHPYNEFVIRLPQLLFFLLYLAIIVVLYRKKQLSASVAVFLTANYYLDEFYGLARGYAMSNTLMLCACISYLAFKRSKYTEDKYLILCSAFYAFSITANTVALLLLPSFGFMWLMALKGRLIKTIKKHAVYLLLWFGFLGIMTGYHMIVTQQKTLFTGLERGFFDCYFISISRMFINNLLYAKILGAFFVALLVLFVILLIYHKNFLDCDFFCGLLIFLAVSIIAQLIFKKGYATERELIPFYSFFVFAVWEAGSQLCGCIKVLDLNSAAMKYCVGILCILLVCNYYRQLDISATRDWNWEYSSNGNYDYGRKEHTIKQYIVSQGDWDKMPIEKRSESDLFYINYLDRIYIDAELEYDAPY